MWISTKKELPENDSWVDVFVDNERLVDIKFEDDAFYEYVLDFEGDFDYREMINPSHWMPLPEPPERVKESDDGQE